MFNVHLKRTGSRGKWVECRTIRECSTAVRTFIATEGIGASEWEGGGVKDANKKTVASVSYNGRVWEPGKFPTPEITNLD